MKHPVIKLVGALVLLCALLFAYYQAINSRIESGTLRSFEKSNAEKLDSIIEAMESLATEKENKMSTLSARMCASAKLEAALLARSAEYRNHALRESEMTVRVRNDRVVYPVGSTVRLEEYGDLFADDAQVTTGTLSGVDGAEALKAVLCACPLEDGAYYVLWVDEEDDPSLFTAYSDEQAQLLSSVEVAHGGLFLDIVDRGQGLEFGYKSYFFDNYETPEAMGITRQVLEERPHILQIGGEQYYCAFRTIREGEEIGVYLAQFTATAYQMQNQAVIITALAGIILLAVTAWHLATQRLVVDKILTKPMQRRYKPSKMRWMALVLGGIGIAVVFVAGCVVHTISDFYGRYLESYVSSVMLEQRLEQSNGTRASEARMRAEWQLDCARRLAEAIELDPALAAGEPLSECNDAIGAMYLMLFDGDGNESACSARYTGFTLGTDPEDSTTDFRRLLLGVPQLIHAPAVDERTGVNTRMVGVSCRMPDSRYGALILAFEPDATDETAEINGIVYSMTKPGWVTLVFDKESKTVLYSSAPDVIGAGAEELGIPADSIRDSYMDAFYLMGERSYGFSSEMDDRVYYYICNTRGLLRRTLRYGCLVGIGFAAIYLILSFYLLLGYTNKWYAYFSVIGSEFDTRGSQTVMADGKVKHSIDPSRRWAFSFTNWRNLLPEQTAKSVFSLGLGLCMAWGLLDALINKCVSNGILLFIISGVWNRGFNLFAVVAILLLALAAVFGLMIVKLALKLTSMAMDTKGETICRLCYNLLQYVTAILLLFYAFEFFGIDVRALLAPLALVSLALSMGSRELVQDILAGITIVFEGEYQVGDVVDVGGYRGKVVEIGVRTTKLLGRGDNIKIISNRDVRNVLNMSRMNSWIDMEFTLSNTVPMQKLEEIMERELPEIGRSIPDIISGPIYKGIVSMNGNRVTVAVTCECNEEVSFRVQRELYAKFHEMFERESLPLA